MKITKVNLKISQPSESSETRVPLITFFLLNILLALEYSQQKQRNQLNATLVELNFERQYFRSMKICIFFAIVYRNRFTSTVVVDMVDSESFLYLKRLQNKLRMY